MRSSSVSSPFSDNGCSNLRSNVEISSAHRCNRSRSDSSPVSRAERIRLCRALARDRGRRRKTVRRAVLRPAQHDARIRHAFPPAHQETSLAEVIDRHAALPTKLQRLRTETASPKYADRFQVMDRHVQFHLSLNLDLQVQMIARDVPAFDCQIERVLFDLHTRFLLSLSRFIQQLALILQQLRRGR